MNKLLIVLGLLAVATVPTVSQAQIDLHPAFTVGLESITPQDLINWKVGDSQSFDVSIASMGKIGTMVKGVTKEEGGAIWITEDLNLQVQQQKVEVLLNRADGKILKMIVNGQEQAVPNDPIEIISQDYTNVTVPAGTFKCIHIVAKSKQISKMEVWANPKDTVMEGTVKQIANTGMFDLTMELTSFKHGQ